jgi:cytochrome P450
MYLNAGHESSGHITMWATVFLQENPDIFAKAKLYTSCWIYNHDENG